MLNGRCPGSSPLLTAMHLNSPWLLLVSMGARPHPPLPWGCSTCSGILWGTSGAVAGVCSTCTAEHYHCVALLSSSESRPQQRGCLEALHLLCQAFPPSSVPEWWGCQHGIPSLLTTSLSLLTASHLAWSVQGMSVFPLFVSLLVLLCRPAAAAGCVLGCVSGLLPLGHDQVSSEWPDPASLWLGCSGGLWPGRTCGPAPAACGTAVGCLCACDRRP